MATPSKSLVKYDRPALVSKKPAEGSGEVSVSDGGGGRNVCMLRIKRGGRPLRVSPQKLANPPSLSPHAPLMPPGRRFRRSSTAPFHPGTAAAHHTIQQVRPHSHSPPRARCREWMEEDQVWRQQVSSAPFTTANVVRLKELLDRKLLQSRARETGLCPERRELYSQCLDELIRMVTIQCAERGLLLLRVRDDIQGTFAAYQTLYESGMSFGVRKMLQAELDQIYSRQNSSEMEKEKQSLRKRVKELRADIEAAKESNDERRRVKKEEREEEIEMLKSLNQQLKSQLEGMLSA
ncbi:axonemal dynein light intermediate polypeptide 1-like isoform 2-T3 [Spinachia spinachia]